MLTTRTHELHASPIYHPYGVELHTCLPPLPTEIFHTMRDRVAGKILAAAEGKSQALSSADCKAHATLTVTLFHAQGKGGLLYVRDEATLERLDDIITWALDHGADAPSVLREAIEAAREARASEWTEPQLDRPALPHAIYEAAYARALEATQKMAARKNMPPAVAQCEDVARGTVRYLHYFDHAEKLLVDHPRAIAMMDDTTDTHLDSLAMRYAVLASAKAQGIADDQLDWDTLILWLDEARTRLRARYPSGSFYCWPDLDGGMAVAFAEFGIPEVSLAGHQGSLT
jgi:hypothetical protein